MADRLEEELRALGRQLDVPPTPDLSAAILTRIEQERATPVRRRGTLYRLRWLVVVAVVLLAGTVTIAASPEVRAGIVQLLRYAGIEIRVDSAPEPTPTRTSAPLPGARSLSLTEARELATFEVLVPVVLGEPNRVEAVDGTPPRVVSLHWNEGVRLDAFDGQLEYAYYKKMVGSSDIEWVEIGAAEPGVWIDGTHALMYVDRTGQVRQETARMAAKTLLWQRNGVTYRLEGDRTLEEMTAIAKSLGQ